MRRRRFRLSVVILNAYIVTMLAIQKRIGAADPRARFAWYAAIPLFVAAIIIQLASWPFVFVWRFFDWLGRYWDRYLVGGLQDRAELCGKAGEILRDEADKLMGVALDSPEPRP
jgi:hypothetical protein